MTHPAPWRHWSHMYGFLCPSPVVQELLSLTTLAPWRAELDNYNCLYPGKGARVYFFSSFPLGEKAPFFLYRIHQDLEFRRLRTDYKTSFYAAPRKCIFMQTLRRNFTETHSADKLWQIHRDNPTALLPDDIPKQSWELPNTLDSYCKCDFGKLQSTGNQSSVCD